jgi:hypothetical protein
VTLGISLSFTIYVDCRQKFVQGNKIIDKGIRYKKDISQELEVILRSKSRRTKLTGRRREAKC